MRVLISGASIAGPVLAYWLTRRGFDVTVIERAPALRKTGGHAIDLFRPAMEITEHMGVLPRVMAHATGTERLIAHRSGHPGSIDLDYHKVLVAISDRHVEIMRDDLSEIYYDAGRAEVEYLFGDEITAIADDGAVTFANHAPRTFDIIVGADGLHSGVRRLIFGADAGHTEYLGSGLAVVSVPKSFAREGESTMFFDIGRTAGIYTARHLDDARAVFLFRSEPQPDVHHRDTQRQQQLLRAAFSGMDPMVDGWLAELAHPTSFYFDSITQLQLTSWSKGRVTLVGDAGYCPGPAVGGSTSLAVLGAYVLAGELARAGGDHTVAFRAYEDIMREPVLRSRALARTMSKSILPSSALGVRALITTGRLLSVLPTRVTSTLAGLNQKGIRLYDSMPVPAYPVPTGKFTDR